LERAFSLDAYHYDPLSTPFWVAGGIIAAMALYVALVRGAPALRYTFLGICVCTLPFVIGYGLNACTDDLEIAELNSRWCVALTPMAGTFVMMFDMALARRLAQYRNVVIVSVVVSAVLAVLCLTTRLSVDGAYVTPSGIPFAKSGPLGLVHTGAIGLWVIIGSAVLWRSLDSEPSPVRRRQYKGAIWAFSICALGTVDAALTYGIGYYPISWFFLTVGSLIALRSLVADDLVRAGSVDPRGVAGVFYLAASGFGVWYVLRTGSPWLAAAGVAGMFVALRAVFALLSFMAREGDRVDSPAQRALQAFARKVKDARTISEVADATRELVQLAVGADDVHFLVPSEDDYSWLTSDGDVLSEASTPDPRLIAWFTENRRPTARDSLIAARLGELREPLERLFDEHRAELIAPLVNRDDLVGLIVVGTPPRGRSLRLGEVHLLDHAAEHATAGVVYARMYVETHARVEVAKEVELAAAVQEAFVPGTESITCGAVRMCGIYAPASRCGGDWWSAHELADGRTLVLIGDVTGHGVAAAMVTAAAKGCYDVAIRMMGNDVDIVRLLDLLHSAVRRTGGDEFYMTCFATLIDPRAGTVTYANAGHVVPYVAHKNADGKLKLDVLVARGNPLGVSTTPEYVAHTRPIHRGDVMVWYTDGVVECTNRSGRQYGDRRFQRALRRFAAKELDVDGLRDSVVREAVMFHEGHPPADDITLVVGKLT
jgi:serine phosphatase RsbU (regulator of sigma subunit)